MKSGPSANQIKDVIRGERDSPLPHACFTFMFTLTLTLTVSDCTNTIDFCVATIY